MYILIDFDGTCTTHAFPNIGKDIGSVPVLRKLVNAGHHLILFTMRCDHPEGFNVTGQSDIHAEHGKYLTPAIEWFKENNIPLFGIQTNPTQHTWIMIDDSALGCPLKYDSKLSDRPFVDWKAVEKWLKKKKII